MEFLQKQHDQKAIKCFNQFYNFLKAIRAKCDSQKSSSGKLIPKPIKIARHVEVEATKQNDEELSNEDTRPMTVCQIKISEKAVIDSEDEIFKMQQILAEMVKFYKETKRAQVYG